MPAQLHILLHFIVNLQSLSVFLHPASQIRFTGRFSNKTRKVVNILGFTKVYLFYLDLAGKTHLNLGFQCNVVSSVQCNCTVCMRWNQMEGVRFGKSTRFGGSSPPSLPLCRGSVKGFTVGDKKQDQPEKLAEKSMCRAKPV